MGKFELLALLVGVVTFFSLSGTLFSRNRNRHRVAANRSGNVSRRVASGDLSSPQRNSLHEVGAPMRVAMVEVTDEREQRVCIGSTPTSTKLDRVGPQSFSSLDYNIHVRSPQGHTLSTVLRSVPNGWYICGEFVFGARAGWLVFDLEGDELLHIDPAELSRAQISDPDAGDGQANVSFLLIDDVADELHPAMRRLANN